MVKPGFNSDKKKDLRKKLDFQNSFALFSQAFGSLLRAEGHPGQMRSGRGSQ